VIPDNAASSKSRSPLAEKHGDEVKVDLVKQPGGQILPRRAGATAHKYVLSWRRFLGHLKRCRDSLGHEREWRIVVEHEGLSWVMGEDKDRHLEGVAPPRTVPRWVAPGAGSTAEHVPPDDHRARSVFFEDGRAGVGNASLKTGERKRFAESRKFLPPFAQSLASDPHGVLPALIPPGREPVEGHRDVVDKSSHRSLSRAVCTDPHFIATA
jgi:hypothetical protein